MIEMRINAASLTPEDCKEWVTMPYWTTHEAILLSLGVNPKVGNLEEDKAEAERLGDEYLARMEKLTRSQFAEKEEDRFPYLLIPSNKTEAGNEVVCYPVGAVNWARRFFLSFPAALHRALVSFQTGEEAPKDTVPRRETSLESSLAQCLADKRWEANRKMRAKAESYVKEQLDEGCLCSHASLADFMAHNAFNETGQLIFNDPDIDEKNMATLLRGAAKKVFLANVPKRVVGNKGYAKPDEECPIHSDFK